MRLFVFTLCLVIQICSSIAQESSRNFLENTLNDYVDSAYTKLQYETNQLNQNIARLCGAPSKANLDEAQNAFLDVVEAWGAIEWFRVGPVLQDNQLERFFFFPDRKSRGLRQVEMALKKQDRAVLAVDILQTLSVALQGLGALDFLLFGKNSETLATKENKFRCWFATSISQNLDQIAVILVTAWQKNEKLRNQWIHPSEANPFFRTDKEAMNLIIGTLIHGLEAIRDTRITVFLRESPNRDRPKSAAFWRSQATMRSIAANLQGLENLFTQSQIEMILPEEASYLGNTIRFEFEQSIRTAKILDAPVGDLLNNPDKRKQLEYLKLTLDFIINRLNNEFAPAAGLAAGFSFGDGD